MNWSLFKSVFIYCKIVYAALSAISPHISKSYITYWYMHSIQTNCRIPPLTIRLTFHSSRDIWRHNKFENKTSSAFMRCSIPVWTGLCYRTVKVYLYDAKYSLFIYIKPFQLWMLSNFVIINLFKWTWCFFSYRLILDIM